MLFFYPLKLENANRSKVSNLFPLTALLFSMISFHENSIYLPLGPWWEVSVSEVRCGVHSPRAGRTAGTVRGGQLCWAHTVSQSNCHRQNPELKTPLAVFSLLELELSRANPRVPGPTLGHAVDVFIVTKCPAAPATWAMHLPVLQCL